MYKQIVTSILLCCTIVLATPTTLADDANLNADTTETVQGNISEENTSLPGENNHSSDNTFIPGHGNVSVGNTYIGGDNNTSQGNTYIQGDNNVSIGNTHVAGSNNTAEGNTYVGGSNNTHVGKTTFGADNKYSSDGTYYGTSNYDSSSSPILDMIAEIIDMILRSISAIIIILICLPFLYGIASFVVDVIKELVQHITNKEDSDSISPKDDLDIKEDTPTAPVPTIPAPPKPPLESAPPPPSQEIRNGLFVSVVFKKGGKPYDYFLGNHIGINVGDEVEVYVHDKWAHRIKRKTARVVYISQPGETSLYARSVIIGKL